jgi:hypothetical protein
MTCYSTVLKRLLGIPPDLFANLFVGAPSVKEIHLHIVHWQSQKVIGQ